jgi:WD40 repeat protein
MNAQFRTCFFLVFCIAILCCAGTVQAASLGTEWTEKTPSDNPYRGVSFSSDGSRVFAGGSQMLVRSWTGDVRWGGRAGAVAAMSADGNYVVSAVGNSVQMIDKNGADIWTRNSGAQIRAVAVSKNGSLIVTADDNRNINSWAYNGEFVGRNQIELAKTIKISPTGSLVAVATEGGLRYLTPAMELLFTDNKSGSWDTFIAFSADGSTVITAGGTRVSSRTGTGQLNWQKDITTNAIIDMACSIDCTTIVIGGQDNTIQALDYNGNTKWKYPAGQWIQGIGSSYDASVIAAGSLDQTLYILDKDGRLLTKKKTDEIIEPRSVAVSRDGNRIAVADQHTLYGYLLLRDADTSSIGQFTPISRTTMRTPTPAPSETTPQKTLASTAKTTLPVTASTPASAINPVHVFLLITGLIFVTGCPKK